MCPSLCYKRSLFDGLRFSPEWRFMLDLDFLTRGLLAGHEFVGVPETVFRYRRHPEQVTVECERNLRMFVEEIDFWRRAAETSRNRGWSRAMAVAERMTIIRLQLVYYALSDLSRAQIGAALRKIRLLSRTAPVDARGK